MNKERQSFKEPCINVMEEVISKIEQEEVRRLAISQPMKTASWPFKCLVILGVLLVIALATRMINGSKDDSMIIGVALMMLAFAGFLLPMALNYLKKIK